MAEPVIVPINLEVTDIDMSNINFADVQKDIAKKMSGIKKAMTDAFSRIDASAINKPIESAMSSVKKSVQAAEDAQLRYNEALIKAGQSTEEYKTAVAAAKSAIANQSELVNELSKLGPSAAPFLQEAQKELEALIDVRNKINPLDFVDKAQPMYLDRIANAYQKVLTATTNVTKQSEKFNTTITDNRLTDEYAGLVKEAEKYKQKLVELNDKSKRMETLGATDKQWEALQYDTKIVSAEMDILIAKMRDAVKTGKAFRFGEGNKGELSRQINSFAMASGNRAGAILGRVQTNHSPFTVEYQKALDELDKLEKRMNDIRAKSEKMMSLGASKAQLQNLAYEAENLDIKVDEAKNSLMRMVESGQAFRFGNGNADAEIGRIRDKANEMQSTLSGVAMDAKKAQGGLTALGATNPKLAAVLGTVGKIAKVIGTGFKAAAKIIGTVGKAVGKVASGFANFARNLTSGIKNMNLFGKSGRSTSNDLNGRFQKLGKNILMWGFGFRTVYYAVKRLRNIFIEAFKTMGDQFDEVGQPMMRMIEALNRLKGSLGTAFQPLVSIVIPYLTKAMNYLSDMLEKIGKFSAALTGQGYIYKAVAKNINSVAGAAKNANNQLGSYDKLEVIQNDSGAGYEYEKQSIGDAEKAISNFATMVKEAWENADFTGVGVYITDQLLSVLDGIEKNLIPKVSTFVNRVLKSVNTFFDGFDSMSIGEKIGSIFNTLVSGLDFKQIGMLFANLNNVVWEFLDGLVNGIDWTVLGQSLSTGIGALFGNLNIESWAGMITGLIDGVATLLVEVAPTLADGLVTLFLTAVEQLDIANIAETLLLTVQTILESVGTAMKESNNPILSAFGDAILAINDAITALRPAVESIIAAVAPIVQAVLPIISELLPPIASIISEVVAGVLPPLVKLFGALMPPIIRLVDVLLPVIRDVLRVLMHDLAAIVDLLTDFVIPIFDVLVGVIEFVAGTIGVLFRALRGEFDSVEDLFSELLKVWKKPINSIIAAVETMVNGVIKGINSMIKSMNKLSFDIPDWVPGIGGQKFGFNLKELSTVKIPRLAQGAVIPPNKEFLAMLGDQTHGTNIEAPLDTIKQALAEVLAEVGGGSKEPIVLKLNGRDVAKVVWDEQEKRYKQTGKYSMA